MKLRLPLLIMLLVATLPATAATTTFDRALKALEHKQLAEFNRLRQSLKTHPLQGYLDYRFLLQRLDHAPPKTVAHFLEAWGDTPWGTRLQHRWLLAQGQQKKWTALLAVQKTAPKSVELQCYYYRARLQQDDAHAEVLNEARQLWLSGQNRPAACDPLFDRLKSEGRITPERLEQRFDLALEAGNLSLMQYLKRQSEGVQQARFEHLVTLYQTPSQLAAHPFALDNAPQRARLIHLFRRWVRRDAPAAIAYWQTIAEQIPAQERRNVEIETARYQLAHYAWEPDAWLQKVLQQYATESDALRDAGVRAALATADWETVASLCQHQTGAYYRYWRLRALEELGRISQSGLAQRLEALNNERSFYALQAAERSGQAFRPEHQLTPADPARIRNVAALPRFKRVEAFIEAGLAEEARAEWEYLLARLNPDALAAAAELAKERQWAYFGIRNAVKGQFLDDLELRFPLVFRDSITHAAQQRALEPSIVFAIARQESAFWPRAQSHVGARGLMQLMPATVRETAKRWNIRLTHLSDLYRPELNLLLGSSYLSGLMDRFDGDIARAAAAYNAGPHRVSRWDQERSTLPHDAWIETIPFRETRNYVQNVLVYRAIYDLRQREQAELALGEPRTAVTANPG